MLMKRDKVVDIAPTNKDVIHVGVLISIAVIAALIGFENSLLSVARRWQAQEEYSHGFLIPIIVLWLLWSRRDVLRISIGQPSWTGPVLILVAAAMHILGELSAVYVLSQLGFIIALFGIVLGFGGFSLLRVTAVPIAFLIFAIPVPYFVDAMLSYKLQLISSQLGTFFIRLFQIPVYLEGNVIDLGNYKLQVVEACSGLRYLYPLMSLGFLAAYLYQAPLWQRTVVFLSTIPITIFMNSFRIAVVGVMVDNFGPQDADGFLHMFEGWVIFIACAGVLIAEMALLARFVSNKRFLDVFYPPKVTAPESDLNVHSFSWAPRVSCLALVALTGVAGFLVSTRQEILPVRKSFATFPTNIAGWHGRHSSIDPGTVHFLALTDYVLTNYINSNGRDVNFYVAYYASQRSGLSPHSPSVCLPGNGWQIAQFDRTNYRGNGLSFPINRVVMQRGSQKQLVYYWFEQRGMRIANEWWSKLYLLSDAIFKNRTDGALIRLITPIYPNEPENQADSRLHDFTQLVVPKLTGYLPSADAQNSNRP